MTARLFAVSMLAVATAACATTPAADITAPTLPAPTLTPAEPDILNSPAIIQASGPFAQASVLPFHAPDFAALSDEQYQPIIEQAIAVQHSEIAAIAANPEPPTFANTLVALERSGQMLDRANYAFSQKVSANINPVLAAADEALAPQLAALTDAIYMDPLLFARVRAVHENRAALGLGGEDAMLLDTTWAEFLHRGALLDSTQQAELRQINERLSSLSAQVSQAITQGQNAAAVTVESRAELSGLSEGQIAAAVAAAEAAGQPGKFVLVLTNTSGQPLLARLDNRPLRERIFRASIARNQNGAHDTRAMVRETMTLRNRIAALFGTPDYASWQMYDRFVNRPEAAVSFMRDMVPAIAATQEREAAALNERIAADGHNFTVQPWDWPYYAEKIRQERFALDNEAISQYLQVDKVLEDGVFFMANRLYGLTFEKRSDIPVYHPDVSVYTVRDHDGSELALFYFDPFARESKRGGAWMNNFVEQSHLLGLRPVIANTLNIDPPAPGQPALMSWDNVTTTFHEFGHALHGIFADQQYPSISGTNTARDWVEFPSQFHEPFAALPEMLGNYARHWQTGEVISPEMVAAIQRASRFDQGYQFGEIIAASLVDMEWHSQPPGTAPVDVMAFDAAALARTGLRTDLVPPRYHTPYFRHIVEHGYQAGYYSYTWTEMLAHDGFDWVMDHGGMTRQNGEHIRASFLGRGHAADYKQMYRDFTGRDPDVEPLLRARGLLDAE